MIASLIILFFVLARLLPKVEYFDEHLTWDQPGIMSDVCVFAFQQKSPFYLFIIGGWSFSVYAIQLVFKNLGVILQEHFIVAIGRWSKLIRRDLFTSEAVMKTTRLFPFWPGYLVLVGFISFAVCYRYGPLVDEKNVNILSWALQLLGLLLIYLGIQIQQVAFAVIIAALISKNLEYPISLGAAACRWVLTGW